MIMINIYMKKLFRVFKRNTGFTLIELLVVIGILGILAAALIATIDPFEQLKKAQDANVKNTAVEFVDATIRYYTTHNVLPWATTAVTNCGNSALSTITTADIGSATSLGCLTALINDGELKPGFTTVTSVIDSIYVTGTSNSTTACFQPQSKSQQGDQNTKYNIDGSPNLNCTSETAGGSTSCYWCAQ